MTTLKHSSITISAIALLAAVGSVQAGEITHLQSLGGDFAVANDINDFGDVVGQSAMAGGLGVVATRWDASHMPANLGMLNGSVLSEAYAINNNGEIVGFSEDASVNRSATLWDGRGGMVNVHSAIGSSGASIPWDINDNGVITGQASINPGFSKGFVWDQVNPVVVAGTTPGFMGGANYGINNAGALVGSAFFFGDPDDATMAIPDGRGGYEYRDIAPIGFEFSVATEINNNGMVVGHTTFGSTTTGWNAVIYTPDDRDPVQVLGTLPGLDTSESLDVNDSGMIVGYAWDGQGNGIPPRAWVWVDGEMYDLNDLLGDRPEFEILSRATGVNNNGDIVGFGRLLDGNTGAFLIEGFTPPAGCVADINGDGDLNFFDVSAFLEAFSRQDPIADMNGDFDFNFFDVSDFLSAFSAGCP
ncbi:MAG: GC-type dockerin domain-anchored protein [Phycisphaerales bacterium]|nr:GC-type dockerin domain-anchored protein [Phycisphaerales bacterium]